MSLRIFSAIQFQPRFSRCGADVMDNFRRLEPLVRQAQNFGTSFLVFPELCLTGYSFLSKDEAMVVAETHNGPTYQKMRGVAIALSSYVSWGYVRINPDNGDLYNSATMINPQGDVVTSYDKINLFSCDFLWAKPGLSHAPIVETEFGSTSLVICRDLRDKIPSNIPRLAVKDSKLFDGKKIDLIAACTNWGRGGGYPPTSFMDFVADNKCDMVVADRWGKEDNSGLVSDFGTGKTSIISSNWSVHTNGMVHGKDCIVTASF